MLISKMFKFEKVVYEYQNDDISNSLHQDYKPKYIGEKLCVLCGIDGVPFQVSNMNEAAYLEAALSIPYYEMLEQLNYYNNTMMDEVDESFWIQQLTQQYNVDGHLVVLRLHAVEKLNKNMLYRRMMNDLYSGKNKKKHSLARKI